MRKRVLNTMVAGGVICCLLVVNTTFARSASLSDKSVNATSLDNSTIGTIDSKEEVIYSSIGTDGSVKNIYSVNIFNMTAGGIILDYGDFDSIKNLTNTNPIEYEAGKLSVKADPGRFYYQGNLSEKKLPWDIAISYKLDNKEIKGSELAGKDGALEISIKTTRNTGTDITFYKYYMLQVSVTLDSENCKNIVADGGTFANSGTDKLITFTVMPGKDGNITVSADVTDFEMKGISLSAVPFSMNLDLGDTSEMTNELTTLADAIRQLNDGIVELESGASKLSNGTDSLKTGSIKYQKGLNELSKNSSELVSGSKKIFEALQYIKTSLSSQSGDMNLSALTTLPKSLTGISTGLKAISSGITKLSNGYTMASDALDGAIKSIPQGVLTQDEINALYAANPNNTALQTLIANYQAAQTIKATYEQVLEAFTSVKTTLPELATSIDRITSGIDTMSGELSSSLQGMDITASINQLSQGIAELTKNYSIFNNGLAEYTNGVNSLATGFNDLNSGISSINEGTEELSNGVSELSDGSNELYIQTKDLPEVLQQSIDDIMADFNTTEYIPVSFVSPKNENVTSVQFVIAADGIEKEKVKEIVQKIEKNENFYTRLIALFKKDE